MKLPWTKPSPYELIKKNREIMKGHEKEIADLRHQTKGLLAKLPKNEKPLANFNVRNKLGTIKRLQAKISKLHGLNKGLETALSKAKEKSEVRTWLEADERKIAASRKQKGKVSDRDSEVESLLATLPSTSSLPSLTDWSEEEDIGSEEEETSDEEDYFGNVDDASNLRSLFPEDPSFSQSNTSRKPSTGNQNPSPQLPPASSKTVSTTSLDPGPSSSVSQGTLPAIVPLGSSLPSIQEVKLVSDPQKSYIEKRELSEETRQEKVTYELDRQALQGGDKVMKINEMVIKGLDNGDFENVIWLEGSEKVVKEALNAIAVARPDYDGMVITKIGKNPPQTVNIQEHASKMNSGLITRLEELQNSIRGLLQAETSSFRSHS